MPKFWDLGDDFTKIISMDHSFKGGSGFWLSQRIEKLDLSYFEVTRRVTRRVTRLSDDYLEFCFVDQPLRLPRRFRKKSSGRVLWTKFKTLFSFLEI
ncbi:hypothetical protein ACSBR2_015960 [Camellia fascicularis]